MPRVYVTSSHHCGVRGLSDLIKQCSLTWLGNAWEISKEYPECQERTVEYVCRYTILGRLCLPLIPLIFRLNIWVSPHRIHTHREERCYPCPHARVNSSSHTSHCFSHWQQASFFIVFILWSFLLCDTGLRCWQIPTKQFTSCYLKHK